MNTAIPTLENESGKYLLSHYGNTFALGFKGDADFIQRSYNFAYNFCATNGSLIELGMDISYIITSPEKLMKALQLYYYNEVIRNREVSVSFNEEGEITVDEVNAEKLAEEKAKAFFEKNIIKENFMFNTYLDKIREFAPLGD